MLDENIAKTYKKIFGELPNVRFVESHGTIGKTNWWLRVCTLYEDGLSFNIRHVDHLNFRLGQLYFYVKTNYPGTLNTIWYYDYGTQKWKKSKINEEV